MKQNDDHHQLKVQARNNDVVVVEDRNVSSANGGRGDDFQPRQNTDGKSSFERITAIHKSRLEHQQAEIFL